MKIGIALAFAVGLLIWPAASLAAASLAAASLAAASLAAASLAAAPSPSEAPASDPEMKHIYDEDQADRSGDPAKIDWSTLIPRDAARRETTRRLLAEGRLHSGQDFLEAAF